MRKKLLLELGLSLATAIFAACGDPGDAATAGDYDDETGLEDGGGTGTQDDGGVEESGGSGALGGAASLGGGTGSRSSAARAALGMGGGFDVATWDALVGRRAVPFITATNGTVLGSTISPRGAFGAGEYSAYLDLTGFIATASATSSTDLAGLIILVNSGTTAVPIGCATTSTFPAANMGATSTPATVFNGDFSRATGAGSVRIDNLIIPSGTTAPYAVRICAKDSAGTIGNGTAYAFNVTTDTAKPADGDLGNITAATSTSIVVPITGFTDDRAIDHLEVRVRAGLVNPASGCTGTTTSTPAETAVATVSSSTLALAGIAAAVPYVSSATSTATLTLTSLGSLATNAQYSMRICAVDVAGNTAAGATGRFAVKATTTTLTPPTFANIISTTATTTINETIFNTTSVQATTAAYAAATLTVQCPNPVATATLKEAELGTTSRTEPPFTANPTCTMEPTVVCSGPRCTATSVGVTDLCPKSGKKLALAITCQVALPVSSANEVVGVSALNSLNASVPASLVLTCPNPADTISALTVDYGDPTVTAAGVMTTSTACTASGVAAPLGDYTAAKAALDAACLTKRTCTVPQGLAATAVVPGFVAPDSLNCPTRRTTAAAFTCTQTYLTSPAVGLQITGAGVGTEICISNTSITSAGATVIPPAKGDCGTTWKVLASNVVQTSGATDTLANALTNGLYPWSLSGGDGLKTVYFKVRDANSNESAVVTRQVRMDTIAPVRQGMLARADTLTALALTNRIYWNRFTESGSGIASYKLVYTTDGSLPPTDCSATTTVREIGGGSIGTRGWRMNAGATAVVLAADEPPTAQAPFFHNEEYTAGGIPVATSTPLTAGTVYTYRVCATDRAGRSSTLAVSTATVGGTPGSPVVSGTTTGVTPVNYAPGATSLAVAAPNYVAPTLGGSFTLQDGNGAITALSKNWSNSVLVDAVTSSLTPAGGGGTYQYCFSRSNQAASCTTSMWKAAAATTTIYDAGNVGGGDGLKTLYAHVRDQYRNVALASSVSSTIYLDRTVPTTPTFTATSPGAAQIALSWTQPTDASSGLATASASNRPYKVTYERSVSKTTQPATPPEGCVGPYVLGGSLTFTMMEQGDATPGPFTLTAVTNNIRSGYTYAYRLCAFDEAGNGTAGVVRTIKAQ